VNTSSVTAGLQCLLKESLGRCGILLSGKPEVDRGGPRNRQRAM
jgi:hypothetical protein